MSESNIEDINTKPVEFSQVHIEEITKSIDKAIAVAAVLENDLGNQRDISTANVVCVIHDILEEVQNKISSIVEHSSI
ncbi:MAG: hypothetical protein HDR05_12515 [Lachnospiraceae bacterium]|nr:hypothetical protein [Lachnospiraceae bacterium]